MNQAPFSVIIPAHNEANVIGRCLRAICDNSGGLPHPEVLVIANGCNDETAQIAASFAPVVVVFELNQSSKTEAMNLGRLQASHKPQIFLDADVECTLQSLTAMADAVRNGPVQAAVPVAKFDLNRSSAAVRAYYRAWIHQPFSRQALGGSGCYALSERALATIGQFPELIADDYWALSRFPREARRVVEVDPCGKAVFTRVHPPQSIADQIRVDSRRRLGNQQVKRDHPTENIDAGAGFLPALVKSGVSLVDGAVFLFVKIASKLLAQWRGLFGREETWVRDESSRQLEDRHIA